MAENLLGHSIAEVFRGEGRPAADRTSGILSSLAATSLTTPCAPGHWDSDIRALLAGSHFPPAAEILAAHACIPWGENPIAGQLSEDFSAIYAVATLMGPDGPVTCPDLRCGLFYQRPNCYYALHSHNAAETYVILAGAALWTAGGDTRMRQAGDVIHHPSQMPHAFRTSSQGFVALWRWEGDIAVDSYRMLDDPSGASGPVAECPAPAARG